MLIIWRWILGMPSFCSNFRSFLLWHVRYVVVVIQFSWRKCHPWSYPRWHLCRALGPQHIVSPYITVINNLDYILDTFCWEIKFNSECWKLSTTFWITSSLVLQSMEIEVTLTRFKQLLARAKSLFCFSSGRGWKGNCEGVKCFLLGNRMERLFKRKEERKGMC